MFRAGTPTPLACPEVLALVPCPVEATFRRDLRWFGGGAALVLATLAGLAVSFWGTAWGSLPFALQLPGLDASGLTRWDEFVSWLAGLVAAFGSVALGWAWWDAHFQQGLDEDRCRERRARVQRLTVWQRLVVDPGTGRILDPVSGDSAPPAAAAVRGLIDRQSDLRFSGPPHGQGPS